MKKLFVYGSLRKGSFNFKKLLKGKIVKREIGKTIGNLFHIANKGYPALLHGDNPVIGEIITIDSKKLLKEIDALERYNENNYEESQYIRKTIRVMNLETKKIEMLDAYMYNINNRENHEDTLKIVPSGDWLKYIERK